MKPLRGIKKLLEKNIRRQLSLDSCINNIQISRSISDKRLRRK